ncbi:transposase, partial [Rhodococcus sp. IEGM 1351]|nr:transposase [Rhodococcus sp. IEGM 1351]
DVSHTAGGVGFAVFRVGAGGSSAQCPGCEEPLTRPGGCHIAWCPRCLVGGHRDPIAGVDLAPRPLLGQTHGTRRR